MSKYELILVEKSGDGKFDINSYDKIESNDLVELLSQLVMLLSIKNRNLKQKIQEEIETNDIPF